MVSKAECSIHSKLTSQRPSSLISTVSKTNYLAATAISSRYLLSVDSVIPSTSRLHELVIYVPLTSNESAVIAKNILKLFITIVPIMVQQIIASSATNPHFKAILFPVYNVYWKYWLERYSWFQYPNAWVHSTMDQVILTKFHYKPLFDLKSQRNVYLCTI